MRAVKDLIQSVRVLMHLLHFVNMIAKNEAHPVPREPWTKSVLRDAHRQAEKLTDELAVMTGTDRPRPLEVDFVFDGPETDLLFVDVENTLTGHGCQVGEWVERDDGRTVLRLTVLKGAK